MGWGGGGSGESRRGGKGWGWERGGGGGLHRKMSSFPRRRSNLCYSLGMIGDAARSSLSQRGVLSVSGSSDEDPPTLLPNPLHCPQQNIQLYCRSLT